MNDSRTITITSVPADVPVSDDRGTVRGASVTLRTELAKRDLLVIPREGNGLDCWLGWDGVATLDDIACHAREEDPSTLSDSLGDAVTDLIDIMADCADAGADGCDHEAIYVAPVN